MAPHSAGQPTGHAAGLITLETIARDGLLENAHARGAQIRSRLEAALAGHPGVTEIRGQGLMIGIDWPALRVLVQRA